MTDMISPEQLALLLQNGRRSSECEDLDPIPVVKLFAPDDGMTWLLSEVDPNDTDRAFGLCDLGLGSPELGHVSLSELRTLRGRLGLPVRCDVHFKGAKPISSYAQESRLVGRIIA